MPVCHKCPHHHEIERLREICAACPGPSDNFGKNVHLDSSPDGHGELVLRKGRVAPDWMPNARHESRIDIPAEAREYLFRLVREFSALTDAQAAIACRMLRGETVVQMARNMKMRKEAVISRWKALCAKSPVWKSLSNGSMGLRGGGRKPTQKGGKGKTSQMELFG